MKLKHLFIPLTTILIISGALLISCNKSENPKATVTVLNGINANNIPMEGVTVKIYSDPSLTDPGHEGDNTFVDPDSLTRVDIQVTDEFGQTNHEFRFQSILHVEAKIGLSKNDTLIGYGALILKENETYNETVILKEKPQYDD